MTEPVALKPRKLLFPISVDSKRFGSDATIKALNSLPIFYDEIIFLIADGLQLYNKATQVDSKPLGDILENFKLKNDYYLEREKWIKGLRAKVDTEVAGTNWTVLHVSSISDSVFHVIYRNVFIAYLAIPEFQHDIIETAKDHRSSFSETYSDYDLNLSIAYIVEEIAINLRLHILDKIEFEYYMGTLPKPLINLYEGGYKIDVFTLCQEPISEIDFKFFHLPEADSNLWIPAIKKA